MASAAFLMNERFQYAPTPAASLKQVELLNDGLITSKERADYKVLGRAMSCFDTYQKFSKRKLHTLKGLDLWRTNRKKKTYVQCVDALYIIKKTESWNKNLQNWQAKYEPVRSG